MGTTRRRSHVRRTGKGKVVQVREHQMKTRAGLKTVLAEMDREYLDAINSHKRRKALRLLLEAFGIKKKDYTIDRGGAHTPSGPEDGAPLYDLTENGIYPEDVYSYNGLRYYGTGEDALDSAAFSLIREAEARPYMGVTIYRAVEKDGEGIRPGDWVTTSRRYAKEHGEGALGGNYKIVSKRVRARDIYTSGDSWLEWGYHPQHTYYPKLVKRDENGNIKPLSVRAGLSTGKKGGPDGNHAP